VRIISGGKLFKSVGIIARYDKKQALTLAQDLAKHLSDKGLDVYLEETLKGKVNTNCKLVPLKEMKTEFVIAIGGDGTILRTCMTLPKPEPPILGVNMGVRGFLTEVNPDDACAAVDHILSGDYRIEKCAKLSAWTNGEATPDALNDVVVSGGAPSKILYLQIYKNDEPVFQVEADGVVVSTQTGSTGYCLSAGGPVLDPQTNAIVVTPICSLTSVRSMVFPADAQIRIELLRPKDMLVIVDGAYRRHLRPKNASVTVACSKTLHHLSASNKTFTNVCRRGCCLGNGIANQQNIMILDTSAFIGGLDRLLFGRAGDAAAGGAEVKRNPMIQFRLQTAIESSRIKVLEPAPEFVKQVKSCATSVGDSHYLSKRMCKYWRWHWKLKVEATPPKS
jgi:NAD+ kinase